MRLAQATCHTPHPRLWRTWRHVRARPVKAPVPAMCMRDRTTCSGRAGSAHSSAPPVACPRCGRPPRRAGAALGRGGCMAARGRRLACQHSPAAEHGRGGVAHVCTRGQRTAQGGPQMGLWLAAPIPHRGAAGKGAPLPRAGRWQWRQSSWRWPRPGSVRTCRGQAVFDNLKEEIHVF